MLLLPLLRAVDKSRKKRDGQSQALSLSLSLCPVSTAIRHIGEFSSRLLGHLFGPEKVDGYRTLFSKPSALKIPQRRKHNPPTKNSQDNFRLHPDTRIDILAPANRKT
jgi:hypothetical protein